MKAKLGWVLSLLISMLLLFSAFGKIRGTEEVLQGMQHLGIETNCMLALGLVEMLAALLFLVPRTGFIGVILITGWMGGAIFAHMRMGEPFFVQVLVPIIAWIGFSMRNYKNVLPLLGMRRPR